MIIMLFRIARGMQ